MKLSYRKIRSQYHKNVFSYYIIENIHYDYINFPKQVVYNIDID